ncbi:hypothetical protein SADUNF_Sadunf11G0071500 [Salix dunnii]|uniref:Uncharacterized protein n=1 Tax=Salix dunnii TaxID=1413687 RepID=A0A835JNJ5_9ROSI|nr:hypothetical protein SADUNF_Sadunf11G0071500 [Salix dunnii]
MRPFQKSGFGARISSRITTAETGEEVNLIEHKQLEKAVERAEALAPASRSASESTSDRTTTVRCTSTEPADTDNPIITHAPPRTRNNNPDERTTTA